MTRTTLTFQELSAIVAELTAQKPRLVDYLAGRLENYRASHCATWLDLAAMMEVDAAVLQQVASREIAADDFATLAMVDTRLNELYEIDAIMGD